MKNAPAGGSAGSSPPSAPLGAYLDLWLLDSQERSQTQGWLRHLPDRGMRTAHTRDLHRSGVTTPIFWEGSNISA